MADDRENIAVDFAAGDQFKKSIECWRPQARDVDKGIPDKRAGEARILDMTRNNGYMSGAAATDRDTTIGSHFQLQYCPSESLIGPGQGAWINEVEEKFHEWADDPSCWIDARRTQNFTSMLRTESTSLQQHGEALVTLERRPSPVGYNTCFFIVDPFRLSRRYVNMEQSVVGGIEQDSFGAPVAYYISRAANDRNQELGLSSFLKPESVKRIPKFNQFGQQQVYHVFESERAEQSRGFSRLMSSIVDLKQIDRYEQTALEQAILAAAFGLYVKSDYGPEIFRAFFDAPQMEGNNDQRTALTSLLKASKAWGEQYELNFDGARIPKLMANDDIGTIQGNHPNQSYEEFVRTLLRKVSAGTGVSYEQLTKDFSNTSYSSARASLIEAWRAVTSKRGGPINTLASLKFRAFMDESVAREYIVVPNGIPYFNRRNRAALTRCKWIGPPKGEIDPLKTARAHEIQLTVTGEKTLRDIAAENGQRWEDIIEQRARERVLELEALERSIGVTLTPEQKLQMLTSKDGAPVASTTSIQVEMDQ